MFQNINTSESEEDINLKNYKEDEENKIKNSEKDKEQDKEKGNDALNENTKFKDLMKELFTIPRIVVYAISFVIATVSFGAGYTPFGIAIIAAILSNNIPIIIPLILATLGSLVKLDSANFIIYIMTNLIFIGLTIFYLPKINKITKQKEVMAQILSAVVISHLLYGIITKSDMNFMIKSIVNVIIIIGSYKIFQKAIGVILEIGKKKVFSDIELISLAIMLVVTFGAFNYIIIKGYALGIFFMLFITLYLGFYNGIILGATSGLVIGSFANILSGYYIAHAEIYYTIMVFIFAGILAGIIGKFGKKAILAMVIIELILIFALEIIKNQYVQILTTEIFIASLGLFFVQDRFKISMENIFKKDKYLPKEAPKMLSATTDKDSR